MYNLKLEINLHGWKVFTKRAMDDRFAKFAQKIHLRDNYICQFCGFQAKKFQNIVNVDGNYLNNKDSNLITACCFCSQCLFLQSAGIDDLSGGQLIYLPEFNQADLNSFVHVVFIFMGNKSSSQELAHNVYRNLRFRSQVIENKFGAGSSDPILMSQMILEYQEKDSNFSCDQLMKDLRLLPNYKKFTTQLAAWSQLAAEELKLKQ